MSEIYQSSEYSYYFCTTEIGSTDTCDSPDTIGSRDVFDAGCWLIHVVPTTLNNIPKRAKTAIICERVLWLFDDIKEKWIIKLWYDYNKHSKKTTIIFYKKMLWFFFIDFAK